MARPPLRIHLTSLGCARTLVDSEVALGGLAAGGWRVVDSVEGADVAVVNTCGFIDAAKAESIETILELCRLKTKGKLGAVVVLGCLAQRFGEEIRKELPEVDGIIGTDSYADLAKILEPLRNIHRISARPTYLLDENTPRISLTQPHLAYIKISEGCINACSYCMIPKMKGPHRSRTVGSVVAEVRRLASERKLSEIDLIGQDTAAFGHDRDRVFELPRLLRELGGLDAAPWIRLLYAHPGHVTGELIDAMAETAAVCKYVDFPVEHSHDAVLKRMNRGVDRSRMEWGIHELRRRMPGVALRTTVIVGFPGETEEEFRDLMDFLKGHRFERLGAFEFSREEGSRAHPMPDQLPDRVKRSRFAAVMEQQKAISLELNEALVGRSLRVLIDEPDPDEKGIYLGRTEADAPDVDDQVRISSSRALAPGEFVEAHITDAFEYELSGVAA
ncbi:MAG: ribosomal protein S12 methylthiotransferase RimO [Omnitrophica bacterium RIFCSPHIGHO2_02_FULL_63_14]|nr:MAG: ribosomal protein S12 methylthiotransferase RimO [Omnitrophica bacterium RIFCSPHIGHO2_02_FULL_63_14]